MCYVPPFSLLTHIRDRSKKWERVLIMGWRRKRWPRTQTNLDNNKKKINSSRESEYVDSADPYSCASMCLHLRCAIVVNSYQTTTVLPAIPYCAGFCEALRCLQLLPVFIFSQILNFAKFPEFYQPGSRHWRIASKFSRATYDPKVLSVDKNMTMSTHPWLQSSWSTDKRCLSCAQAPTRLFRSIRQTLKADTSSALPKWSRKLTRSGPSSHYDACQHISAKEYVPSSGTYFWSSKYGHSDILNSPSPHHNPDPRFQALNLRAKLRVWKRHTQ